MYLSDTTFEEKDNCVKRRADQNLRQQIFIRHVHSLWILSAADNLPSEQLDDVADSEDDSTETYDMEEAMAVATDRLLLLLMMITLMSRSLSLMGKCVK